MIELQTNPQICRNWTALFLVGTFLNIAACDSQEAYELSGSTMGTTFSVTIVAKGSTDLHVLQVEIESILDEVNRSMSSYDPNSEVSLFNEFRHTNYVPISKSLCDVIDASNRVRDLTDGAFEIAAAPAVKAWGFGPSPRRQTPPEVSPRSCRSADCRVEVECSDQVARKTDPHLEIDLSGIAKGYAVDNISEFLSRSGFGNHLVEIGGEVRVAGRRENNENWQIGVESPDLGRLDPTEKISISNIAVATSGSYRNFFQHDGVRYSHLIDPETDRPVANPLVSVTVLHESAMIADALATGLFVLGIDRGLETAKANGFSALFITDTDAGIVQYTTNEFLLLTSEIGN